MSWWPRLRPYLGWKSDDQGRLVIIPTVLFAIGLHGVLTVGTLLLYGREIWAPGAGFAEMVARATMGLGGPVALAVAWRRSRPTRRAMRVYDWIGGGLLCVSTGWMLDLVSRLWDVRQLDPWGALLVLFGWTVWSLLGILLLITGSVYISREITDERRERHRLEALMEFTRRITSLEYQATLDTAVKLLYPQLGADACLLYLWNETEQVLVPAAGYHDPTLHTLAYMQEAMAFRCPRGFGLTGWVAETGQPVISGDVVAEGRGTPSTSPAANQKSAIVAPIQVEGRLLGVVRLTRRGLHAFNQDDLQLVMSFAGQAALVIENARIMNELQEMSITDGLTGLHNARHFHQVLSVELSRSRRYGQPLTLVMVDSDSLKELNDSMGHQRGDEYLRRIGRVLRESTRLADHAFRYAGDEFMLLLTNTGPDEALVVAERIRREIQEQEAAVGVTATVSVGVAVAPLHASTPEALMAAADRALYVSKRAGKNRVSLATPANP